MLVTNPPARATLAEVMNHPWMTRGFPGPPDPHLVHREPLRSDELDRKVIRGMKGFEFGTEEEIERRLLEVLESDAYNRAVQYWERKRGINNGRNGVVNGKHWDSPSNTSLGYESAKSDLTASPSKKLKRFSGFDFYRRKLFSPASSPPASPMSQSPPTSQSHLSLGEAREPADPTYGFHPLISIYFLAREKMERERVYGPGHFASSQLSLTTNVASNNTNVKTEDGSTKQAHSPPKATTDPTSTKADYSMALPLLPAPESSHYSGMSYDPTAPTPSPATQALHPQPRPRDSIGMGDLGVQPPASPNKTPIRAPQPSTHKRSHSLSQRQNVARTWTGMFGPPNTVREEQQVADAGDQPHIREPPKTAGPEITRFSEKMDLPPVVDEFGEKAENTGKPVGDKTLTVPVSSLPPVSTGAATLARKFGSLLGKGDETRRPSGKRTSILGGLASRPSADAVGTKEKTSMNEDRKVSVEKENEGPGSTSSPMLTQSQSQQLPSAHRRAHTVLDSHGRTGRHERRGSTGGSLLSGGTVGRHRRPSTGFSTVIRPFGIEKPFGKTEEVDENAVDDGEMGHGVAKAKNGKLAPDEEVQDDKDIKPVFLKGLFRSVEANVLEATEDLTVMVVSVATTSTKSPSTLRSDIRQVLDRMQIRYRETRTGFDCIHVPSIDLSSFPVEQQTRHRKQGSSGSDEKTSTVSRRVTKRPSKLSFRVRGKDREKGKEREGGSTTEKDKDLPSRPSGATTLATTPSSESSSFFNVTSHANTVADTNTRSETDSSAATVQAEDVSTPVPSSPPSKTLPPIPRDYAGSPPPPHAMYHTGELDEDAFESIGANRLSVRFEINIVKVGILFGCVTRGASWLTIQ